MLLDLPWFLSTPETVLKPLSSGPLFRNLMKATNSLGEKKIAECVYHFKGGPKLPRAFAVFIQDSERLWSGMQYLGVNSI